RRDQVSGGRPLASRSARGGAIRHQGHGRRTGLLPHGPAGCPQHKYTDSTIADYAGEGAAEAMWSPYHGTQPGDPAKLGDALVELAGMATPPQVFVAGSDALAAVAPVVEGRLKDMRAHEALSRSTDGVS